MSALALLRAARAVEGAARYRHGWIPVAPLAVLSPGDVDDEYGRELDSVEFGDTGRIVAREHGVTVESDSGSDVAIHASPSAADAQRWADAIDQRETFTRPSFSTEPQQGGGVSARFGNHEVDLDDDEAGDVAQGLRDMAYVSEDKEPPDSEANLHHFGESRQQLAAGERVLELYQDEDHPRGDSGTAQGGQFIKAGGSGTPTTKPAVVPKPQPGRPAPPRPIAKKQPTAQGRPVTKTVKPKPPRKIRRMQQGDKGPKIAQLQAALRKLHIGGKALKLDGTFGPQTMAAVMAAQEKLGMKADGQVSASLLRKLNDAAELSPC
jgi:hypothetical protein